MYLKSENGIGVFPEQKRWLISGVAGFIGSHLLERLLSNNQEVVGLDNLSTGTHQNLAEVRNLVGEEAWQRFKFIEGDIRDRNECDRACSGISIVLHHAAIGSVDLSIKAPVTAHDVNVTGFLNLADSSVKHNVEKFIYASSSAVYGDLVDTPTPEHSIGKLLSPYAATKRLNEIYAEVFQRCYGLETIGLRYFNVYGSRQSFSSAYSSVIPRWMQVMQMGGAAHLFGSEEISRDFCHVSDVVDANILAAKHTDPICSGSCFNIGTGVSTSLKRLHQEIAEVIKSDSGMVAPPFVRDAARPGDIISSLADLSRARDVLGYRPQVNLKDGLKMLLNPL